MDKIQTTDVYVLRTPEDKYHQHTLKSMIGIFEKKENMVVLTVEQARELILKVMWEQHFHEQTGYRWAENETARQEYIKSLLP